MPIDVKIVLVAIAATEFFFVVGLLVGFRLHRRLSLRTGAVAPPIVRYIAKSDTAPVVSVSRNDLRRFGMLNKAHSSSHQAPSQRPTIGNIV
jgi:hypothetical protein